MKLQQEEFLTNESTLFPSGGVVGAAALGSKTICIALNRYPLQHTWIRKVETRLQLCVLAKQLIL